MNVIVTGASSGIGAATALRYARRGAGVGLIARRADRLAAVADEVRAAGGRPSIGVADVGDRAALERAIAGIQDELGPCDVLICNAGMPGGGPLADVTVDQVERVLGVNTMGAVVAIKAVLPSMLERRRGSIVLVASIAGRTGLPGSSVYAASKFAMVGMAEALAGELAPRGIRVATVNPGPVRTESWPHRRLPARYVLAPDAIATVIVKAAAGGPPEVTVPRAFYLARLLGVLAPPLYRRILRRIGR